MASGYATSSRRKRMATSRLSKLQNDHGNYLKDKKEKDWVYHVSTPHLLIQAAGYLKHVYGKDKLTSVFYRGQSSLYNLSLIPSLYRGTKRQAARQKRDTTLKSYLGACKKQGQVLKQVPEYAWEPLLQHYGIKTRWLDVVDNVWVALWFACHTVRTTGKRGEYLHFEPRPIPSGGQDDFAYVLLMEVENGDTTGHPGLHEGTTTQAVDLRVASPSTFLRPHAQHGLLIRKRPSGPNASMDYYDMNVGIIRVNLRDAFQWLGGGSLLTTHVLFPPPVYDFGYRDLLGFAPMPDAVLGAIHNVGA
jgi:hypothetical protein